jgi:Mg-chelatase subunit ChlD
MQGQKISLLRDSLNYIVKMLKEQDRLSLIKFSDSAKIIFPLLSMTESNKTIARQHISGLRAVGGTNLMAALQ